MSANSIPKWYCYIKPTRYVHYGSKFRTFEVGYCQLGDDNKVTKTVVLGLRSDAIHLYDVLKDSAPHINMDLTRDGYIRFFSWAEPLNWKLPVLSDAILVSKPIDEEWCEKKWEENNKERGEIND